MSNTVNLNEVGAQSKFAGNHGDQGDAHNQTLKNHAGKMDGMRGEFKGQAGTSFQRVAYSNTESGAQVGKRLFELALSAVKAEKTIVASDEEGHQDQTTALSSNESTTALVSKSIHA